MIDQTYSLAPGIEIVGANLQYEGHLLFQNLNFTLASSKWTCLLGPSGVGKSSLLRLIANLTSDANVESITATDNLPLRHRVSYMAQQDSLLPWLTVLENITIGTKLRGQVVTREHLEKAKELLVKVKLERVALSKPESLSGGMRQRVILARTLFENRPIILMDEPFAALDVITRTYIQEIAAELLVGRTVLLVTHDPMEALRLGHHVYIMSGSPALITSELELSIPIPRQVTDVELLKMHADILERLSHARQWY